MSELPPRFMSMLREMADSKPKGSRGPWEYGDGTPMQKDAKKVLDALQTREADLAVMRTALDEAEAMTNAYAKAMKDAGVSGYPEALASVRKARAAIEQLRKATGGQP